MTTMNNPAPLVASAPLAKIVADGGIAQGLAQRLVDTFAPFAQDADDLIRSAAGLTVTDATQLREMGEARTIRLKLVKIRSAAEKARQTEKADYLKVGKIIDGIGRYIAGMCEPEEARLLEAETFAERAEAARLDTLQAERRGALQPILDDLPAAAIALPDLRLMPGAAWTQYLADALAARKARDDAKAAAAQAAREQAEAEAAEREAQRIENLRLKAEKAEADRLLKDAQDKARWEKDEADRKLAAERAERERVENEARQAREAQERADRERQEAEAKAKAKAAREARKAAAAPDAEKLRAFVAQVAMVPAPEMRTDEGRDALRRALNILRDAGQAIAAMADEMGGGR